MQFSDSVEDDGLKHIKVKYVFTRFHNPETGYAVVDYKVVDDSSRFTATGYFLPQTKHMTYVLTGSWKETKYGEQFFMESYNDYVAPNKGSIIEYLASGAIKGIGKKTAEKIYAVFGNQTIDVLDSNPEELLKVKGISKEKLKKIIESYKEGRGAREILSYLLPLGISTNVVMKIFGKFKGAAMVVAKEDPYKFCRIKGFSFHMADLIAKHEGLAMDSYERFKAATHAIYGDCEAAGSLGIDLSEYGRRMLNLLNHSSVSTQKVNELTMQMIQDGNLTLVKTDFGEGMKRYIFPDRTLQMEKETAENICRILKGQANTIKNLEKAVENECQKKGIVIDPIQKKAIMTVFKKPLSIITGGPGTGKTTILKLITSIWEKHFEKKEMLLSAPTGRAARVMSEATGLNTYTTHSLTHFHQENEMLSMYEEEEVSFNNSLIIVDEFSMADAYLSSHLFHCIKEGNTVVIMGDVDQLPSVGAGAVLRDMISSDVIPVVKLLKVYRQSDDAEIAQNARRIREGQTDIREGSDFKMFEVTNIQQMEDLVIQRFLINAAKYGAENVMCLAPFKEHSCGTIALNRRLQEAINPPMPGKPEVAWKKGIFRVGDLVMQLVNDDEACNGDIGIIKAVSAEEIVVFINGIQKNYEKDDFEKLTLAYARTYHKSQGSEGKCVIMALSFFHKRMLYRNLPYTGITRGKEMLEFVGEKEALAEAIKNVTPTSRITCLAKYIRVYAGRFQKE